jgi:hypothetical protein
VAPEAKPDAPRGAITRKLIAGTTLRGEAGAEYLEGLARESQVARSELLPVSLGREGGFLLERDGWHLRSGDHTLARRSTLRWRETPAGWKVVFWRWTLFR